MTITSYKKAEKLANEGRLDEALAICAEILSVTPDDYLTLYLSGAVFLLQREYEQCRLICNKLFTLRQDNPDAFNMMAAVCADHDMDFESTEMWLGKALACSPTHPKALINLGNLALQKWELNKAAEYYNRALKLSGNREAAAYNGLAGVESVRSQMDKAIYFYEKALECAPHDRAIVSNLIGALYTSGRKEDALALSKKVAHYESHGIEALSAFSCFRAHGLWDDADPLLPVVLDELCHRTNSFRLYMISNLNILGVYEASNAQRFAVHKRSGESIEKMRIRPPFQDHPNAFKPSKRIRLGYLSSDLKAHVVSHFFRELVNCRQKGRFELFLYSNLPESEEDELTDLYRKYADHFVNTFNMTDVEIAEMIRDDGVHILVDMGGYTTDNRLLALSYRPAPVQVAYLGYPFTYGLKEIDYHISDPWLDGPSNADYMVEKPLRMPQSFITIGDLFEQHINPDIPFKKNGYITFGSLNNVYKLNPQTIALMSQVMARVTNSRIILNHPNYFMPATQESVLRVFSRHGISSDRIDIIWEKHPTGSHLRYYNDIDIVLDAMPLTGGTTTIDALWMGVPVVTKVGETHPERLSYSIINNVGIDLSDCIGFSEEEYIFKAVELAGKSDRLQMLRNAIPEAMRKGILCDPIRFTAQLEALLIDAWNLKFPDTPIESLLGEDTTVIDISETTMVARSALNDMHTYVVSEQGKWYESEAQFLERHAKNFRCFLDFSDDPGMFAIPIAASQKATNGKTLAFRRSGLASILLRQTIDQIGMTSLQLIHDEAQINQQPDLVRFSLDCNDGHALFVSKRMDFLKTTPLVLVSLRSPAGNDLSTAYFMWENGYQAYRLLPGYDVLVPFSKNGVPESSWLNLFFCQHSCAKRLFDAGLLSQGEDHIAIMPTASDPLWMESVFGKNYSENKRHQWEDQLPLGEWGDMYFLALNLDANARKLTIPPGQRHAMAEMAFSIISLLLQESATPSRLMTGVRIAVDLGLRTTALNWAIALAEKTQDLSEALLDEPFLMPIKELETIKITESQAEWVKVVALVTIERLRSFSSWYTVDESKDFWQGLMTHPIFHQEATRMVALIDGRLAQTIGVKVESSL